MNFFKRKSKIVSEHVTRKDFNYSRDNIVLNFSLRVDVKSELEVFKELLLKAVSDIEQELSK